MGKCWRLRSSTRHSATPRCSRVSTHEQQLLNSQSNSHRKARLSCERVCACPLDEHRGSRGRQPHLELAAAAGAVALGVNAAAVELDEALHQGQADAEAALAGRALSLQEGL